MLFFLFSLTACSWALLHGRRAAENVYIVRECLMWVELLSYQVTKHSVLRLGPKPWSHHMQQERWLCSRAAAGLGACPQWQVYHSMVDLGVFFLMGFTDYRKNKANLWVVKWLSKWLGASLLPWLSSLNTHGRNNLYWKWLCSIPSVGTAFLSTAAHTAVENPIPRLFSLGKWRQTLKTQMLTVQPLLRQRAGARRRLEFSFSSLMMYSCTMRSGTAAFTRGWRGAALRWGRAAHSASCRSPSRHCAARAGAEGRRWQWKAPSPRRGCRAHIKEPQSRRKGGNVLAGTLAWGFGVCLNPRKLGALWTSMRKVTSKVQACSAVSICKEWGRKGKLWL